MEINTHHLEDLNKLIEDVEGIVLKKFNQSAHKGLSTFIRQYLTKFPGSEWLGRELNDLCGFVYGLWLIIQKRPEIEPEIKAYNPNLDEHGWLCGRTVITVLQRDMPFLVDSIRISLNRQDMPIHVIYSCVMNVIYDEEGKAVEVVDGQKPVNNLEKGMQVSKEALIYVEISLQTDTSVLYDIKQSLNNVLGDVSSTVNNYPHIRSKLKDTISNIQSSAGDTDECVAFLEWLSQSHFTFLGYREFEYGKQQGEPGLIEKIDAREGVFERLENTTNFIAEKDYPIGAMQFHWSENLICFSKSAVRSNVHRDVYPDYVVLKKFDGEGNACGEVRFLGLFTYSVYTMSPRHIPILRKKAATLIEKSGLDTHSHDGKNFIRVIENFPKEELFQSDVETLFTNISSIAAINERHVVRLILRQDPFGSFVNCMVYVPKDVYNTRVRLKIQEIIGSALQTNECDSTTFFSESILARAQFVFKIDPDSENNVDENELEEAITNLTKNWDEYFQNGLVDAYGESKGISLFNQYKHSFPQSYQENYDPRVAVSDIEMLNTLGSERDVAMHLYQPAGSANGYLRFKVLHLRTPIELSDVIPILENLGLRVLGEHPFKITRKNGEVVWLHDFDLVFALPVGLDVQTVRSQFEQAFAKIWSGQSESDAFNRLVLAARINWREVSLVRAYAGYLKQIAFNSTREFIADTLVHHVEITRNLIALFRANFDPRLKKSAKDEDRIERLQHKIIEGLDQVSNLNEDIVLRRYMDLINGTLRTNYFQKQEGEDKSYISIKFSPRDIADIPEPRPMYEIYVYSPRVEGVHLRGGKVARGGLRWSDRNQDFRTEVLGLVKAQQVKNAVIVPNGAKGGFVAKQLKKEWSREEFFKEGIECYKLFIRGLLDVTDNLVNGEIVPPVDVVRKDDDDPYLVVAADKGTATFSDIANEISLRYKHWLGDAFASGGSQGYDHKGMGITAKGAWVSVQRHFKEKGINVQEQDFSVVGIGDMAGDVFGNGMLLSEHICLVGAFNHMHIFVDPHPEAKDSFAERKRLFETPGATWADYNNELISKGGGVFSRSAKSIKITPQMKKVFGMTENSLTPTALISKMLKAPVDLIWNGGIGTYVKASWETHSDVGDKANDNLRVNGNELQCQVFGEGGNLGLTQLGRVEFALNGGACNTDFIDNAAGVDCSDHEVNIKILLDEIVESGDLTSKQRNKLLSDMTDSVSDLVLQNNYRQTFSISLAEYEVDPRTNEYRRFISYLETTGRLDRALEYLPADEDIVERLGRGKSLTRPELSVLISYAKVMLKEELIASSIAEDDYIVREIETAFPEKLRKNYSKQIYSHRLRREIVGTQVANDLINNLGITAAHRLLETTGASISEVAKAYIISRDVFKFEELQHYIKSLDHKVKAGFQAELMTNMIRRVRRGTRWFLRNRRAGLVPAKEVTTFCDGLSVVYQETGDHVRGSAKDEWFASLKYFEEMGVSENWAQALSMPSNMFSGLGIVQASLNTGKSFKDVSEIFYLLLDKLSLSWFATQLSSVNVESYWQALARESFIDDLESQVRKLTESLLRLQGVMSKEETLEKWHQKNQYLVDRWKSMVNEVQGSQVTDYAMFSVALRELIDLTQATSHCESL